jgi:hypothetical protein
MPNNFQSISYEQIPLYGLQDRVYIIWIKNGNRNLLNTDTLRAVVVNVRFATL